jgi:ribosomal protein L12E/L44/L45/RPP1/RPP2
MKKPIVWVAVLALALSGCFFRSKSKTTNAQPVSAAPAENHGQERSAEAHEANAERKEAKDAAKDEKKDEKGKK